MTTMGRYSGRSHLSEDSKHRPGFIAYPASKQTHPLSGGSSQKPYGYKRWSTSVDGPAVLMLTLLCAFTRLYQIGKRAKVTWDESHFGKFGAYYINRTFYHDVHPPLAKMLIGLSELLAGHNGTFRFKEEYPDYVDYRFMRRFTALFGIALAPLAYITCIQLGMRRQTCVLASLFVILDNALCVMSRFASLRGSKLSHQPFDVMFGSTLNIRSMHPGSGLLHSHSHNYPDGSQQQQITCYGHKDSNNNWVIIKPAGQEYNYTAEPLAQIHNGDTVRLLHRGTGAILHSHSKFNAPVTTGDLEVTCYGKRKWADKNNDWRIEIVHEDSSTKDSRLHTITTQFRLRHIETGCLLSSYGVKLPSWGFSQAEVSCKRGGSDTASSVLWVVERHINSRVPSVDMRPLIRKNFVKDFVRLNIEMARSNNALVPDKDKYNHLESDPWTWPFLIYPMRMLGSWKKGDIKYYEIGNPLLWWSATFVCFLYPLQLVYYYALHIRQIPREWADGEDMYLWNGGKLLWFGWALHYLPFFLMGRVTYIHHYLPALYFSLLLLAFEIEFCSRRLFGRRLQSTAVLFWAVAALLVFYWFAPFTFGYVGEVTDLKLRQWLPTWNIYTDTNIF
ncbi:Protein O-mannosyltransferase 2 [Coemansia interrupta]|uniref:Dolichyl-phosphate-mannose--protein mannosyltransferase n=1 Tax=Coemansia interrupta TaxID=1126814 RepID=A0A9W8HEH2_9FUNG|nr:Protein O-mannosyltransferase 2 [Coemansia interrupta]